MSRAYQIAVIQTVMTETVRLADVLGRVPTNEFAAVLESDWARNEGWVKNGEVYTLPVSGEVTMELRITGEEVVITRRASAEVQLLYEQTTRSRQQELLQTTQDAYQLHFNRLLGRVMLTAIGETMKEQRKISMDLPIMIEENAGCYELQLQLAD